MNTAVQDLIERIENQIELSAHNKLGTNRTSDYRIGLQAALGFCFDALELEKQQIIEAYTMCWFEDGGNSDYKLKDAEQYFSQTYKQD